MNEALRERKMDYAAKLNNYKYEWMLNFTLSGIVFTLLYVIIHHNISTFQYLDNLDKLHKVYQVFIRK
jgi:hypothetical protein